MEACPQAYLSGLRHNNAIMIVVACAHDLLVEVRDRDIMVSTQQLIERRHFWQKAGHLGVTTVPFPAPTYRQLAQWSSANPGPR